MQIEGEKEKWQGYTLVVEWSWSADKFVEHLKRYAKTRGVDVAPWDASKPDEGIIVNLLWPAQGSPGYWPLLRAHVILGKSTLKCMVEADPGTFATRPEGEQIAREFWLGYRRYLEDLGEVKMAELADGRLDYPETREQAEMQVGSGAVGEEGSGGIPEEPDILHASRDDWFNWFWAAKHAGSRINLKKLAPKMGLAYSYVRKLHAKYQEQKEQIRIQK